MAAKKRWLFDVVGVLALVSMVTMLVLLAYHRGSGFGELGLEVSQAELEAGFRDGYAYYGLYMGQSRVGRLYTEQRQEEGGGYQLISRANIELKTDWITGHAKTDVDVRLDPHFRLQSFDLSIESTGLSGSASGEWADGELSIETELAGSRDSVTVALEEAPLIRTSLRAALVQRGMGVGDRVKMSFFDPVQRQNIEIMVIYRGEEAIELMGKQGVKAHHFEERAMGFTSNVYVNALGEVLLEELPGGIIAVREPEVEAMTPVEAVKRDDASPSIQDAEWLNRLLKGGGSR